MPAPKTANEFLDLLQRSGLVEPEQLSPWVDTLRAAGPTVTEEPATIAGLLVRDGLLTPFQADHLLQGKWRRFTIGGYRILEHLGGKRTNVYLCQDLSAQRHVAVKVLPTSMSEDSRAVRFLRESRIVAAFDHPNIIQAYAVGQDDTLFYMVLEYVDGSSLKYITKKKGPMAVVRAAHYVRAAALGLQDAHERGIVHRNIKPAHIIVDRAGGVKIIGWGLAGVAVHEPGGERRGYATIMGTPDFMAPEQGLDFHCVDIRADIYSLGATFYYVLTGKTLFGEGTIAQKILWHQSRQPEPIRELCPDVPEGMAA